MLSKHIQMLNSGLLALFHLNIPSSLASAPICSEASDVNGNDFTTHIKFGMYKKILFTQYRKLLFFVPPAHCQTNGRE
jgi:hypothetical protein